MNILFDCDNTMGLPSCDNDDGLTLLYLLGSGVNLLGITSSFGNSTQEKVYENNKRLIKKLGLKIPVLKGAPSPEEPISEASRFLLKMSREVEDLHLLVTGGTTNLYGAFLEDPSFFDRIQSISFMGGIEKDLFVDGKPMKELNFSVDFKASFHVFSHAKNITIATAHEALKSEFLFDEFYEEVEAYLKALKDFMVEETRPWYEEHRERWPNIGHVNWDMLAAVALIHPEVITLKEATISPSLESLKSGCLNGGDKKIQIRIPTITDRNAFKRHVYDTYRKVHLR